MILITNEEGMRVRIVAGNHVLYCDEPEEYGGTDTASTPYELLLASLGACKAVTMRMYAKRKNIPLETVRIVLNKTKINAEDCQECETKTGTIDKINMEIVLTGNISDEQRNRLMEISEKCLVQRTLTSEVIIESIEQPVI